MIVETARAFSDALPDGGMLIGLDPGTKTVGVALCDAGWRFATAGKTLPRGKFGALKEALAAQITQRKVAGIVIGLAKNMDGSEGPRAQAARALARNLDAAHDLAADARDASPVDPRWHHRAAPRPQGDPMCACLLAAIPSPPPSLST